MGPGVKNGSQPALAEQLQLSTLTWYPLDLASTDDDDESTEYASEEQQKHQELVPTSDPIFEFAKPFKRPWLVSVTKCKTTPREQRYLRRLIKEYQLQVSKLVGHFWHSA
ncbi:hypothetical protein ACEPPN_015240 [Leptodophora sp. 'Broadleaf-Isolate-01']